MTRNRATGFGVHRLLVPLSIAVVALVVLAACGGSSDTPSSDEVPAAQDSPLTANQQSDIATLRTMLTDASRSADAAANARIDAILAETLQQVYVEVYGAEGCPDAERSCPPRCPQDFVCNNGICCPVGRPGSQ